MDTITVDGFLIEITREVDGRWIADALDVSGAIACAWTRQEAVDRVVGLARSLLLDEVARRSNLSEAENSSVFAD